MLSREIARMKSSREFSVYEAPTLVDVSAASFDPCDELVVKRCGCGREYTQAQWNALPFCGFIESCELRNCMCGSTIGICRTVGCTTCGVDD